MKKIFCLSAILAVYVVSANGDSKCQNLARIVGGMPSVELRQYNCTPAASNNGTHQFITFTTTSIDPPSKFYFHQISPISIVKSMFSSFYCFKITRYETNLEVGVI